MTSPRWNDIISNPAGFCIPRRGIPPTPEFPEAAATTLVPVVLLIPGLLLHNPHDATYSVACAPNGAGGLRIVVIGEEPERVLQSADDGLTWSIVSGDGLEKAIAKRVVYDAAGGRNRFLIGTDNGVFELLFGQNEAHEISSGLPVGTGRRIVDLIAPQPSFNGPAALLNQAGCVYLWDDVLKVWKLSYDFSGTVADGFGALAMTPRYNKTSANPAARTIMAAANGVLATSTNGGATWSVHPTFNTPMRDGWAITALALGDDYITVGQVMLGRGRSRLDNPNRDEGEIWRSLDWGGTFQRALGTQSAIAALAASPPGPSGARYFFAAGLRFPNYGGYQGTGVLRSVDGGATWNDFGNEQDFVLELGPEEGTGVRPEFRPLQKLLISPNYAADGSVFYGRAEGLFRSRDEGLNWRGQRTRPPAQYRDLDAQLTPAGHVGAFGSGYGTGTVAHDLDANTAQLLLADAPFAYQKAIAVSPNYRHDGTVLVSGEYDVAAWYDPAVPPANPFGATGWRIPDLRNAQGYHQAGYARVIAFSPHYDGRGLPGSDKSFYWSSWDTQPMRSRDGGLTSELLAEAFSMTGQPIVAPFMPYLVVARTYNAATSTGRTDVYGAAGNVLYRLDDTRWRAIASFAPFINGLAVDPGFSRPGNPRLFVALGRSPSVAEVFDYGPGNVGINYIGTGLEQEVLTDIAVGPDYAQRPVVYVGTWGSGVLRLDRAVGVPVWQPVAAGFPNWFVERIALSPRFAADRQVLAGTLYGLVKATDTPGSTWQAAPTDSLLDEHDSGFTYYAPGDLDNPQPTRPWPWDHVPAANLPATVTSTGDLLAARTTGSYLRSFGRGSQVRVRTLSGPMQGSIQLVARDYITGAIIASSTFDLSLGQPSLRNFEAVLNFPGTRDFTLEVSALLDLGEDFHFDGLLVAP